MVTQLAQQDFVTHVRANGLFRGGSLMLGKRASDLQPTIRRLRSSGDTRA